MSRALALVVVAALSGCSLLFDPSKVDSGTPQCPDSTASCPARDNADVACNGAACAYTCKTGFADRNLDLDQPGSNGCETSCAGSQAAVNPPFVFATVGLPGQVELQWPDPGAGNDAFHVCTGTSTAAPSCGDFPARAICSQGACTVTLDGLPDNSRVQTTVTAFSFCNGPATSPAPPSASYTTINGQTKNSYQIDTTCGATITDLSAGVIQVAQSSPGLTNQCLTVFQISDNQWGDGFVQVDVNTAAVASSPTLVGVAMQTDSSTGYAVAASVALRDNAHCTDVLARTTRSDNGALVASSVYCPTPGKWTTLRLTGSAGVYSISTADEGKPLQERIRWPAPAATGVGKVGRPALLLYTYNTSGQTLFRNFRLGTNPTLPPRGPTSASYDFSDGGFPGDWRAVQGVPLPAKVSTCPTYPPASGCNGCAPAAGTRCAGVFHQGFNGGLAMWDLPVGIDVTKPWTMSMHFASADSGFVNAQVASTMYGGLLDVAGGANAQLRTAGTQLGFPMEFNTWHRASWVFNPDADGGTWSVFYDGRPVVSVPKAAAWDRHPGRFSLGGAALYSLYSADSETWVSDVQVTQP